MAIACEVAAPFVANSALDGTDVIWPLNHHTASCLKCQARHAAMAKTGRQLRAMAAEKNEAPRDLEWRVMSSLEGDLAVSRSWAKPVTLTAAALSMIAAIVIWRLRPRANA
ncbi:MAG: hypothetical protein DWQ40_06540 [Actinobacteria bacterium]|nr:MAG: hypothetical protein DWQ40_06540 [Actinomycetota bacterium]REK40749.1 MAG: hypothetical protein DWQ20_01250 [Actinomycetota bacterium]